MGLDRSLSPGIKGSHTSIGDIANHAQNKEQIQLDVAERLLDLVPLELLVLDARLIAPQPLDDDPLLAQAEALGRDGAVRQEDVHDRAPDAAQGADDQELELPARQRALDVADAEPQQAAQRDAEAVGEIPRSHGAGLFGALLASLVSRDSCSLERNDRSKTCGRIKHTLYHMLVISMKLGSEHASAAPAKALRAARPAKLCAAA